MGMTRRKLREKTFELLFRADFYDDDGKLEQQQLFLAEHEDDEEFREVAERYESILPRLPEIDAKINERTEGWKTSRMGKVELTILRLAVYEIRYDDDVPAGVAINEAVELAKKFGPDSAASFVNGILAKFA